MIKDGYASAPKFHGSLLRIKKPNVVIVFSNKSPLIYSLSRDRWKIYIINHNYEALCSAEDELWESQKHKPIGFTEIYDHLGKAVKRVNDSNKHKGQLTDTK